MRKNRIATFILNNQLLKNAIVKRRTSPGSGTNYFNSSFEEEEEAKKETAVNDSKTKDEDSSSFDTDEFNSDNFDSNGFNTDSDIDNNATDDFDFSNSFSDFDNHNFSDEESYSDENDESNKNNTNSHVGELKENAPLKKWPGEIKTQAELIEALYNICKDNLIVGINDGHTKDKLTYKVNDFIKDFTAKKIYPQLIDKIYHQTEVANSSNVKSVAKIYFSDPSKAGGKYYSGIRALCTDFFTLSVNDIIDQCERIINAVVEQLTKISNKFYDINIWGVAKGKIKQPATKTRINQIKQILNNSIIQHNLNVDECINFSEGRQAILKVLQDEAKAWRDKRKDLATAAKRNESKEYFENLLEELRVLEKKYIAEDNFEKAFEREVSQGPKHGRGRPKGSKNKTQSNESEKKDFDFYSLTDNNIPLVSQEAYVPTLLQNNNTAPRRKKHSKSIRTDISKYNIRYALLNRTVNLYKFAANVNTKIQQIMASPKYIKFKKSVIGYFNNANNNPYRTHLRKKDLEKHILEQLRKPELFREFTKGINNLISEYLYNNEEVIDLLNINKDRLYAHLKQDLMDISTSGGPSNEVVQKTYEEHVSQCIDEAFKECAEDIIKDLAIQQDNELFY